MENVTSAVNRLGERIRSTRQKQGREIEAKRAKLSRIMQDVADFKTLIASRPDLENAAELNQSIDQTAAGIREALDRSNALETRMKRNNLNIVVAGAARQGKSQMLQMLSGLTPDLIPTGDGGFCTAAQSRITNDSSKKIRVHFLTKERFLCKKIEPYYVGSESGENLGLSPKPRDVQDFINSALPVLQGAGSDAAQKKHYNTLKELHTKLQANAATILPLLNSDPHEVNSAELKPYITKDDSSAVPLYLAVDYVEIHTMFPNGLPEGTMLIDLPGVSEMAANIRENMMDTIRKDADIVLMMKQPRPTGDAWDAYDYQLFTIMEKIFPDLNYRDWLAVIVNENTKEDANNTKQVLDLIEAGRNDDSLPQLIRCNCGSKETVADMLDRNLETLLQKTQKLDDVWYQNFLKEYENALTKAKKLYADLCKGSGNIIDGFDYKHRMEEFRADLRDPIQGNMSNFYGPLKDTLEKCCAEQLDKIFKTISDKYSEMVKNSNEKEDAEFPIFTRKRLETLFRGSLEWKGVIEKAGHQQKWAIITLIRHHFRDFLREEMNKAYLAELMKKMDEKGALTKICGADLNGAAMEPEQRFRFLQEELARDMQGEVAMLSSALDTLLGLEISADGNVLPYFVNSPYFQKLEPGADPKKKDGIDLLCEYTAQYQNEHRYADFAKYVFDELRNLTGKIFKDLRERGNIKGNLSDVLVANANMFILQFYFGETVEDEWAALIKARASRIWPEEFSKAAGRTDWGRRWQRLLSDMRTNVQ